jgi:septal ring factor EnvC (AmiA/AmiB activator)
MEKSIRNLLILLVLLVVATLVFSIMGINRNLRESMKLVKTSQEQLNEAKEQIDKSKETLDSMQADMKAFGKYMEDIQQRVHILDLERRNNDRNFLRKKDSINLLLDSLYKNRGINGHLYEVKEFK